MSNSQARDALPTLPTYAVYNTCSKQARFWLACIAQTGKLTILEEVLL